MQETAKSTTGLEDNLAGFLCYVAGFITGIVFLIVEKKSSFVKFHAMQSTIIFLGLAIIPIILGFIPIRRPIINLLVILVEIVFLILWILLPVKALRGERYGLPIVGRIAEQKAGPAQGFQ